MKYDVIRMVAIMAVVMIHCSFPFLGYAKPAAEYFVGNFFDGISRLAVPLFLMISGALILGSDSALSIRKMAKRAGNILWLLVSWSLIHTLFYEVLLPLHRGRSLDLEAMLKQFVLGHYHLWYLYALIGLYLISPFIKMFADRDNMKYAEYFIGLSVVIQFIPTILNAVIQYMDLPKISPLIAKFDLSFVCGYTTYFVLGYYLSKKPITKQQRWFLYGLGLISLITILLGAYFVNYKAFYNNKSIVVLLYASAVFMLIQSLVGNRPTTKTVSYLSGAAFGIYACHVIVLEFVYYFFPYKGQSYWYVPAVWVITMAVSLLLVAVGLKIPLVKKLLRG